MDSMKLLFIFCTLVFIAINCIESLKCRINDGPSEEEMKNVVRSCMRKLSEDKDIDSNENDDQHDDDEEGSNRRDQFRTQNRGQLNGRINYHFNKRSAWDWNKQQQHSSPRSGSSKNSSNSGQHLQGGGSKAGAGNGNGRGGDSDRNIDKHRGNQNDRSCVIHCFFEELSMLNKQDFPDKHKVIYVITRDIRDNELREFYTDAIQECFRFLEMEQRMDKCQYSKRLINCLAEYARANCEDWYNHTMIFNR